MHVRNFSREDFDIDVGSHELSRASGDLVDKLFIVCLNSGDLTKAKAFVAVLHDRYSNKSLSSWFNGDFDD